MTHRESLRGDAAARLLPAYRPEGSRAMRFTPNGRRIVPALALATTVALAWPAVARAGKLSWLDEVVQQVVRDAEAGGKTAARSSGRLFVREADEGLEVLARRSEALARSARRVEEPAESVLKAR